MTLGRLNYKIEVIIINIPIWSKLGRIYYNRNIHIKSDKTYIRALSTSKSVLIKFDCQTLKINTRTSSSILKFISFTTCKILKIIQQITDFSF